jgi:hypothetical protein
LNRYNGIRFRDRDLQSCRIRKNHVGSGIYEGEPSEFSPLPHTGGEGRGRGGRLSVAAPPFRSAKKFTYSLKLNPPKPTAKALTRGMRRLPCLNADGNLCNASNSAIAMKQNFSVWFRIAAVAIAYIIMMAGVLSVFSIPFYATLLLMAVGTVIALLSDRTKIPMTRSSWIVLIAGCAVIYCVLALFGNDRIHHWTPFPAGYIPAWFAVFHGFRHIRYLISHIGKVHNVAA